MSTVPSPAELWWRIRWLAGTAVPPEPDPDVELERAVRSGQRAVAAYGVTVDAFAAGLRATFAAVADYGPPSLAEIEPRRSAPGASGSADTPGELRRLLAYRQVA